MRQGLKLDEYQRAFREACLSGDKLIVFCNAVAGSGKTTIAMDAANVLVQDSKTNYDGILYIVSPYGEGKQGYLPGSITEKSEVYFEPAYQAMIEANMNPNTDICTESMASKKRGDGFVKLLTHTYLRGTNMGNKVIIIDEAQNFTTKELKKVLTRIHDNSKVIVIGHAGQIDIAGRSGFVRYIDHFKGQEKCAECELKNNYRGWISTWADGLEE